MDHNETDEEVELAPCPVCRHENEPMGNLGFITWYRCRMCGMDYRTEVKR